MDKQKDAMIDTHAFLEKILKNSIQIGKKRDAKNGFYTVDMFCAFIQNKIDYATWNNLSIIDNDAEEHLGYLYCWREIEKLIGYLQRQPDLFPHYLYLLHNKVEKGMNIID